MKTALKFTFITLIVLALASTSKAQNLAAKAGPGPVSSSSSAIHAARSNPTSGPPHALSAPPASGPHEPAIAAFNPGNPPLPKVGGLLSKVSGTAAFCAAVFLWLLYALLVRVYTVRALIKTLYTEENLIASGIFGDTTMHHPALLAIRKWTVSPDTETDRVYRWLDSQIASVFGALISRGEFLRTACLNISFGATILAFVLATSGGHDIDRMLAEVSAALGATLVGLVLFTIESLTLASLNAEAVRLEFEGRELIDVWAAGRPVIKTKSLELPVIATNPNAEEKGYANAS